MTEDAPAPVDQPKTLESLQPVQKRILEVLYDGEPHLIADLHKCLADDLARYKAVHKHLTRIRRVVKPMGMNVLCVYIGRRFHYQLVRIYTRGE